MIPLPLIEVTKHYWAMGRALVRISRTILKLWSDTIIAKKLCSNICRLICDPTGVESLYTLSLLLISDASGICFIYQANSGLGNRHILSLNSWNIEPFEPFHDPRTINYEPLPISSPADVSALTPLPVYNRCRV